MGLHTHLPFNYQNNALVDHLIRRIWDLVILEGISMQIMADASHVFQISLSLQTLNFFENILVHHIYI
jgi:hypothetical protein